MKPHEIKTGDVLFLQGKSKLAQQIQQAQYDRTLGHWKLNHCGWFLWINGILCVAEEDFPGVFSINMFQKEYIDTKADVYVGRVIDHELNQEEQGLLLVESLTEESSGKLTNYAFLDILSFKMNSLIFKWFKKDVWIGRKKNKHNRYTCSQRTCKYIQDYYGLMFTQDYLECYPAEIADLKEIKVEKIEY